MTDQQKNPEMINDEDLDTAQGGAKSIAGSVGIGGRNKPASRTSFTDMWDANYLKGESK